jgi:tetratricopeptide (TPR) repeat protein
MMHRDPALLDDLPPGCKDELEIVLAGGLPSARQRWHLSVRELLVHAARRRGGVVVALDDMHLADFETRALIAHVSRLSEGHAVAVVMATDEQNDAPPGFEQMLLESAMDADEEMDQAPHRWNRPNDLPVDVVAALEVLSLVDGPFDLATVATALDADAPTSERLIALSQHAGIVEDTGDGRFRFRAAGPARALGNDVTDHRRLATHALLGQRFQIAGADPRRVAHHYLEAGDPAAAVPAVLAVARDAARAELHHEALEWTARVLDHATPQERFAILALRAESLSAVGDPTAVITYRDALQLAAVDDAPGLRAGLARAEMLAGNVEAASEALDGLEADGGAHDGAIWLAQGMLAYFLGDLDASERATDAARGLALAPGSPTRLLDVIALQGMIAHNRGRWSDRLYRELRNPGQTPDIVATVFDSHLCVAEYMLYGPTPYDEVVALAENLRRNADEVGARRATAFAICVAGEAELLAGNLERAQELLEESVALHRELVADTGLAHSLQRLAEVRLASGDRDAAERLGREALVLARWSPLSRHILQRTYGTLIAAAPDLSSALAVVDEAAQVLDGPTSCMFCQVMIAVPSAIACAAGGRLDEARHHLAAAELSAMTWEGTAWQGAVTEARACLLRAEGDESGANRLLATAADLFERAGQPIDVERCRDATTV